MSKEEIEKAVYNIISSQQSNRQNKIREVGRNYQEHYIDICVCCRREMRIVRKKFKMCATCFDWCSKWVRKQYGHFNKKYLPDAIIEYRKPKKCMFFDICGNYISKFDENGVKIKRQHQACDSCTIIYQKGIVLGNMQRKRTNMRGYR